MEIKNSFITTSKAFEVTVYSDNSILIEDMKNHTIVFTSKETSELIKFLNYAIED